jgi:pSer/pThr/pTyr-binding forkhead associated (FHA) protein
MEDYTVSRHHCLLDLEDSAVSVRDLNSLNGTYLNGALIGRRDKRLDGEEASLVAQPKYALEEGDELRVGDVVFRVSIAGSPEEKDDSDTEVKAAQWDYTACL